MSATTVLARKWRPKTFAQLAGQEHVVRALSNALAQNRLHHAYLFTGTRGVGKTTIARIFAKSLNCLAGITPTSCGECSACKEIDSGRFIDLIELDAASNTGIDNMREVLDNAQYAPTSGRFKVYIIDEVHMLSRQAFNSMLKTLEEPPGHVKFILATTDPQKIPVTVLSRCLQFNLKQLPPDLIITHLQYVLEQEKIAFEPGALALIARAAQGSMRDALSLLDQAIAFSAGKVEEQAIRAMLGAIDQGYLFDLLEAIREQNGVALIEIADNMATRGVAFDAALQELATLLHRIALLQTIPKAIELDDPERVRLLELAQGLTAEEVHLCYQIAIHGRDEIDLAPDEYAGFTMTLLRMLAFAPARDSAAVVRPAALPEIGKPAGSASNTASAINPDNPLGHEPTVGASLLAKNFASKLAPTIRKASNGQSGIKADSPVEVASIHQAAGSASGSQPDWGVLLNQLKVQGMAQQLAMHCTLLSFSDSQITLCLSQDKKQLQTNKTATEKLQSALSDYFAKPVKLNIVLGSTEAATPAALERQDKQLKQMQASDSIAQDGFVREAQSELGATLIAESVKSIKQV